MVITGSTALFYVQANFDLERGLYSARDSVILHQFVVTDLTLMTP